MKYSKLAELCTSLEETPSSLKKTEILSEFIASIDKTLLEKVILLVQGKVFPDESNQELGIGSKLVLKALSSSTGIPVSTIEADWSKIGDIGLITEKLVKNKKQMTLFSASNSISTVFDKLAKIATLEGSGAVDKKLSLIKDLISNASANEAKFILRTCIGDLRIGVGAGVLRDSISKAFNVEKTLVQKAYNLSSNFANVALEAKDNGNAGLKKIKIEIGTPLKVMLFKKKEIKKN